MLEGYMDLRGELVELLGADITEDDIDVAVQAIITSDHTTATPALAELNTLAQSEEGKRKLRDMMGSWILRERAKNHPVGDKEATLALNHLLEGLDAERRQEAR
jgi:hypothetical protein